MGYSISLKFKNEGQKLKALCFIEDNQDIINEIARLSFLGSVKLPNFKIEDFFEDQNIPYGPRGKNLIGWKETGISQGLYAFVLWMSHKCGHDFYYYDEKKFKFIVNTSFNENSNDTQVNEKGIVFKEIILPEKGLLQKMIEYLSEEENKYEKLTENLEKLEINWTKALDQEKNKTMKKKM